MERTRTQTQTRTPDIRVYADAGPMTSVYLLTPETEAGENWLRENTQSEDWQWLGNSLAVEHRYAGVLALAAQADGLEVR